MSIEDWSYDKDNHVWAYLCGPGVVMQSPRDGKYVAFFEGTELDGGRFDDEQQALRAIEEHALAIKIELEGLAS